MHIHVILNTCAAKLSRSGVIQDMRNAAPGCTVHATDSFKALDAACEAIAIDAPSLVILCGGDGTASAGITHLIRAYGSRSMPPICLATGGSSCTVARNWGRIHRDPRRHLGEVVSAAHAGSLRVTTRPTLQVHDQERKRFGFIFGAGLVASFFEAFYERGGGGYAQASHMIARIFLGSFVGGPLARRVLSPTPCRLHIDGVSHPNASFTLIVAAVVKNLGMSLLVPHRAGEDPLRPHLVASSLSPLDCGRQYERVLRGRPLIHPRTVDRLAERFDVDFGSKSGGYVLDGDLLHSTQVTVQAGPLLHIASLRQDDLQLANRSSSAQVSKP